MAKFFYLKIIFTKNARAEAPAFRHGVTDIDAWKTKSNRCCVKDMKDRLVYFHQNDNHNIDILFVEPYQEFNFDGDKDYIKRWYIRANKLIDNIPQDDRKAMYIIIWGI